jgi:hypothetical protein
MNHYSKLIATRVPIIALAITATSLSASKTSGAIIVQYRRSAVLPGGLVQYTVSAVGTQGETIAGFQNPSITPRAGSRGIHNVWFDFFPSPTKDQHNPLFFNADWARYDTYFLYNSSESASFGPEWIETNDGSTTGTLGLSSSFVGAPPRTGFGEYTSDFSSKGLMREFLGTNVPFFQVVMRDDDVAALDATVFNVTGRVQANVFNFDIRRRPLLGNPEIRNLDLGSRQGGELISATLPTGFRGYGPLIWSLEYFTGAGASVDPNTGEFRWDSRGALPGSYEAFLIGTTPENGLDDFGRLTFRIVVPEPSTFALLAVSMFSVRTSLRRQR